MLYPSDAQNLVAVTFDSVNFQDLTWMLAQENLKIDRVDPFLLLDQEPDFTKTYVNLVVRDMDLREQISKKMDQFGLSRFSFVHFSSTVMSPQLGKGTIIYPNLSMATNCVIGDDVIIHGQSGIGHNTKIGNGTLINGLCMINGGVTIGNFCHICSHVIIYDQIKICDHVTVAANSLIRKPIRESGVYLSYPGRPSKKIK